MKYCVVLIWLMLVRYVAAQDLPWREQEQLEQMTQSSEGEIQEGEQWLLQLESLRNDPLNLNEVIRVELLQLPFLNELQIASLLDYRDKLGAFISIYELQAVPLLDVATIRKMLPFVRVGPALSLREDVGERIRKGNYALVIRASRVLEKGKGYKLESGNRYLGDPHHLGLRYRYQYKDQLYWGITADKDPGEQFFRGTQKTGFDFYSFHFFSRKLGPFQTLALGDFTVNMGQGLIHWQSLALGKGSEVMMIKRQSPTLMPYRSAGEFHFKRGIGFTMRKGNLESTLFFSRRRVSANLNSEDSTQGFTGFSGSGYHRTPSEIEDRKKLGETSAGATLHLATRKGRVGLNAVMYAFSLPLQKRDAPYRLFAINGDRWWNASVDYAQTFGNLHTFGEFAIDRRQSFAWVQGMLLSVDPAVDVSVLYRRIDMRYQSVSGRAFTETSMPTNETGFYAGVLIRPAYGWTINAYADVFAFPWLRYRVNGPTRGGDILMQIHYQPNKSGEAIVRFRCERKAINGTNIVLDAPVMQDKKNLRLHVGLKAGQHWNLRMRTETVWYKKEDKREQGFLAFIDAGGAVSRKVDIGSRLQYFETNSYDSRVYAYESGGGSGFSIPAFSGKGIRVITHIKYSPVSWCGVWFRVGRSFFEEGTEIGSGLDEINGRTKTDCSVQLSFQWH